MAYLRFERGFGPACFRSAKRFFRRHKTTHGGLNRGFEAVHVHRRVSRSAGEDEAVVDFFEGVFESALALEQLHEQLDHRNEALGIRLFAGGVDAPLDNLPPVETLGGRRRDEPGHGFIGVTGDIKRLIFGRHARECTSAVHRSVTDNATKPLPR